MSFHPADVSGIDWMVWHGRSLALSVAVNVAPRRLCTGRYSSEVQDMILSNAMADRVRLWGSQARPPLPKPDSSARASLTQHWVGRFPGWGVLHLLVTCCALGSVIALPGPSFII